ncbi:MAG: putative ABC transport system permease protein, partial [Planctomycetota bacterium]
PSEGGHRVLLVDGPGERLDEIGMALTRGLEDLGLSLERTGARLDAFHAVQNTYLSVFQMLGGLGLLLGSVGLAVVLLRNTFERRSELALCGALGFRDARIRWWVAAEYGVLLLVGLGVGLASSMVAVMPAMRAPGSDLSLTNMFVLGIVLAVAGGLWILLAARVAVERAPLTALGAE